MKITLFAFAFLLGLTAWADEMVLKGRIVGKNQPKEVLVTIFGNLSGSNFYTVPVKEGQFELRGVLEYPALAFVRSEDTQQEFGIWLENVTINAIFEIYQHPDYSKLLLFATSEAKGSTDVEFFSNLHNNLKKSNRDNSLSPQKYEALRPQIENHITHFPKSYLSLLLIDSFMNKSAFGEDWGKKQLSMLDSELLDTEPAKDIYRKIKRDETNSVGRFIEDFQLPDVNGKNVSLSSFKAKYILVEFWSSWCAPCRKESPELAAVYNLYRDKGLEIVGISMDETKEHWLKAIEKDKLTWPQVCDFKGWKGNVAQKIALSSIPYNMLLDEDRKIVAVNLHRYELRSELQKLMPSKPAKK